MQQAEQPKRLISEARERDESDPLRRFRERFFVPAETIYLDGNSLGLLSRDAEACLLTALEQWRTLGVEGWTEADPPWFTRAETLSARVANLVGAEPEAVAVTGSTTGNLHQLLATLFEPTESRNGILADTLNFSSDIYAIESHLRLRGLAPEIHLRKVGSRDGRTLDEADIVAMLADDVAVAVLPSVLYTSGQLLDMEWVTAVARERNILIGWDLSHSIGTVPHFLDEIGADFAFWCHYKYLNAGPGAVGGLYINRRHWGKMPGLAGWWGSDKTRQFDMAHTFTPATGAAALQVGTPPILALAPLAGTLTIHEEAGMTAIRAKSLALTDYLRRVVLQELAAWDFGFATPPDDHRRGGHLALVHPEAAALGRALRRIGVVPDYRPPDILRLAPVALYNTFTECWDAVQCLKIILETGQHRAAPERSLVP
ncbi:MAG: kynureninase [Armatimonadaceae bacterium]